MRCFKQVKSRRSFYLCLNWHVWRLYWPDNQYDVNGSTLFCLSRKIVHASISYYSVFSSQNLGAELTKCPSWSRFHPLMQHTLTYWRDWRERDIDREREREQTGRCQKALKMRAACKLFLWQYSFLLGQHSTRTEIERQRQRKKTVGERESGYGRADWRGPY